MLVEVLQQHCKLDYWPSIIILRNFFIAGAPVAFGHNYSQVLAMLVVLLAYLILLVRKMPYKDSIMNNLEVSLTSVLLLLGVIGIINTTYLTSTDDNITGFLTIVDYLKNVLLLLPVLLWILFTVVDKYTQDGVDAATQVSVATKVSNVATQETDVARRVIDVATPNTDAGDVVTQITNIATEETDIDAEETALLSMAQSIVNVHKEDRDEEPSVLSIGKHLVDVTAEDTSLTTEETDRATEEIPLLSLGQCVINVNTEERVEEPAVLSISEHHVEETIEETNIAREEKDIVTEETSLPPIVINVNAEETNVDVKETPLHSPGQCVKLM
jgi:hypothetical protein